MFIACDLDFASGHVYANDGYTNVTWGGHTYSGVGIFAGIEVAEEALDIIAKPVTLSLSGVDSTLLTTLRTEVYQGRTVTLYVGFVDETTGLTVDTPEILWEGRMNQMSASWDGSDASIKLSCEHRLRREPRIARYTHADQQMANAGDRFFDLVGKIPGFRGTWGAAGVANNGNQLSNDRGFADWSYYYPNG